MTKPDAVQHVKSVDISPAAIDRICRQLTDAWGPDQDAIALIRALANAATARAWQPIETAPKNGTQILVAVHDYGDTTKPRHVVLAQWAGEDDEGQGGEWRQEADDECSTCWPPTHWLQVPEVPK